jgi:hypothetical protein
MLRSCASLLLVSRFSPEHVNATFDWCHTEQFAGDAQAGSGFS